MATSGAGVSFLTRRLFQIFMLAHRRGGVDPPDARPVPGANSSHRHYRHRQSDVKRL
ncbi:hypothetical protein SSAG_02330 [Streptomyces sp. Mg1]|nr:hypothetical protein SSAG_02330 [Streptomyces sp. Mg1]